MTGAAQRVCASFAALALSLASCHSEQLAQPAGGAAGVAGATPSESAGGGGYSVGAGGTLSNHAGAGTGPALGGAPFSAGGPAAAGGLAVPESAGAAGTSNEGCGAASVGDLEVYFRSSWDPLGYPPYAFDGCTLVYVATGSDQGALHVRDLATGRDEVLEAAASRPRRPTVAGPVVAWEADGASGSEVRVRIDAEIETLSGAFVRAEEPRATADAVVFTAFLGAGPNDDSDVYLFDVASRELSPVASGVGQQRFADVSPTHVAFTDFSEDPQGYFNEMGSISDIAVVERATGVRSDRPAPGKQGFPLLGANGVFAYLEWAAVHPEPKLGQFWLKVGRLDRPVSEDFNVKTSGQVSTNPAYVRPSLRGLNLDFIDQGADGVALFRAALGTPGALASLKIQGSPQLFGPVAGDRFTLLANQRSPQSFALLAVPR